MASGSVFIGIEIDKATLKKLRELPGRLSKIRKQMMLEVAAFWHAELFPSHFTPFAERRYGYAPRTKGYMTNKRKYGVGPGRYVANIFTGESRRRMMQLKKITGTGNTATVRMDAPTYFRKPAVGTFTDKNGRTFTIKRQPNKVDEVTRVNADDMKRIRSFASKRLQKLIADGIKP